MLKINLRCTERLLALVALTCIFCQPATAAPRWELVGSYKADDGADATAWIDLNSLIRTQNLTRVWVVYDYSKFQVGDWVEEPGKSTTYSKSYMSSRQIIVIDCATKDQGYGAWAALDGPKGTGSPIHSINLPVPTKADQPVPPGSVGEAISEAACKQRR